MKTAGLVRNMKLVILFGQFVHLLRRSRMSSNDLWRCYLCVMAIWFTIVKLRPFNFCLQHTCSFFPTAKFSGDSIISMLIYMLCIIHSSFYNIRKQIFLVFFSIRKEQDSLRWEKNYLLSNMPMVQYLCLGYEKKNPRFSSIYQIMAGGRISFFIFIL
jgi:hypothetical protein